MICHSFRSRISQAWIACVRLNRRSRLSLLMLVVVDKRILMRWCPLSRRLRHRVWSWWMWKGVEASARRQFLISLCSCNSSDSSFVLFVWKSITVLLLTFTNVAFNTVSGFFANFDAWDDMVFYCGCRSSCINLIVIFFLVFLLLVFVYNV